MRCIFCQSCDTQVKDSRASDAFIKRKRVCCQCKRKFSTIEMPFNSELYVCKKSGNLELFDKNKLLRSLYHAAKKTNLTKLRLEQLMLGVVTQINVLKSNRVSSHKLRKIIANALFDNAQDLYIRFCAIYQVRADQDSK